MTPELHTLAPTEEMRLLAALAVQPLIAAVVAFLASRVLIN